MPEPRKPATEKQRFWGRVGGLRAHGLHGPEVMLSAARQGFRARFSRLADPEGRLDPVERQVRASRLQRAYMLELAGKSAAARKKRAGAEGQIPAPAEDDPDATGILRNPE